MNNDFLLGRQFSARTQELKPDSSQKLLALLIDFTGADDELASAFRLLFSNPIYVSLFIARDRPGAAEVASLSSISSRSLSSSLSARVDSFIAGYFDALPAREILSDPGVTRSDCLETDRSVLSFPSSQGTWSSSDSEEVTLFVDDSASETDQSIKATPQDREKPKSPGSFSIPAKPIVLGCVAIAIVIASFKVSAICEPFGLCEKAAESSTDKNNDVDPVQEPTDNTASPGSDEQQSPVAAPVAEPSAPVALDPPPRRSEVPFRNRPPVATPPRDAAPMRDQPLW